MSRLFVIASVSEAIQNGAMKQPAVYIVTNRRNGTLYTGVTSDLVQRIWQHKQGTAGFTARYDCKLLVWYEIHEEMLPAIAPREADQGRLAPQEASPDRGDESGLGRSL